MSSLYWRYGDDFFWWKQKKLPQCIDALQRWLDECLTAVHGLSWYEFTSRHHTTKESEITIKPQCLLFCKIKKITIMILSSLYYSWIGKWLIILEHTNNFSFKLRIEWNVFLPLCIKSSEKFYNTLYFLKWF